MQTQVKTATAPPASKCEQKAQKRLLIGKECLQSESSERQHQQRWIRMEQIHTSPRLSPGHVCVPRDPHLPHLD